MLEARTVQDLQKQQRENALGKLERHAESVPPGKRLWLQHVEDILDGVVAATRIRQLWPGKIRQEGRGHVVEPRDVPEFAERMRSAWTPWLGELVTFAINQKRETGEDNPFFATKVPPPVPYHGNARRHLSDDLGLEMWQINGRGQWVTSASYVFAWIHRLRVQSHIE